METGGSSLELTQRRQMEEGEGLYKAAFEGDLQAVMGMLGTEEGLANAAGFEWEANPLRGLIEGRGRPRVAAVLLSHYGTEALLLQPRCPDGGNTLLHHAALHKKEKLAIFLIKFLCPLSRQSFLEAVNDAGETPLHIATKHLLDKLVAELLKGEKLKVNMKDKEGKTALDLIRQSCYSCTIRDDWKIPWKISISLRGACAKMSRKLGKYEDEEDILKKLTAIEMLIMNEEAWNVTLNICIVVATLVATLVFAAVFSVPQSLAPGSDNDSISLQDSLRHNIPFNIFIWSLTLAFIFMIFVIVSLVFTITLNYSARALLILFSWFCFFIMGLSLTLAYLAAIYMYMGSKFTYIMLACGACLIIFNTTVAFYFDIVKVFWEAFIGILRMTLMPGFLVTILLTFLPKSVVIRWNA